jgi:hypothetical protein
MTAITVLKCKLPRIFADFPQRKIVRSCELAIGTWRYLVQRLLVNNRKYLNPVDAFFLWRRAGCPLPRILDACPVDRPRLKFFISDHSHGTAKHVVTSQIAH